LDGAGNTWTFGADSSSREVTSDGVLTWQLSEIRDPVGNRVVLDYLNQSNVAYVRDLAFVNQDSSISYLVRFNYAARSDTWTS
ncbi:hypothetical protein, partial [Staphylococcus aureus]